MAITYTYSVGVNKPIKHQVISSAATRIANTGNRTWTYTDGTSITFTTSGDQTPVDGDYIIIMADQKNVLMKAEDYASTYFQVA